MKQEEKRQEAEYRRGYQGGYLIAINTITQMLFEMSLPPEEATSICYDHGLGRLSNWMAEEPTGMVTAPEPKLWEPVSQYDQHPAISDEPRVRALSELMEQRDETWQDEKAN